MVVDRLWTKRHEVESRKWHAKRDAYRETLAFLLRYEPSKLTVIERKDGFVDVQRHVATLGEITSALAPALLVAPEHLAVAMYRFCTLALDVDHAIQDVEYRVQHEPQSLHIPRDGSAADMAKFHDWLNQKELRLKLEESRVELLDAMRADLGFAPRDVARAVSLRARMANEEPPGSSDSMDAPDAGAKCKQTENAGT